MMSLKLKSMEMDTMIYVLVIQNILGYGFRNIRSGCIKRNRVSSTISRNHRKRWNRTLQWIWSNASTMHLLYPKIFERGLHQS